VAAISAVAAFLGALTLLVRNYGGLCDAVQQRHVPVLVLLCGEAGEKLCGASFSMSRDPTADTADLRWGRTLHSQGNNNEGDPRRYAIDPVKLACKPIDEQPVSLQSSVGGGIFGGVIRYRTSGGVSRWTLEIPGGNGEQPSWFDAGRLGFSYRTKDLECDCSTASYQR
jgi:hypothetical protein